MGLIREVDRTIQEKMENHFVGDLNELGYNTVSSLQEYGPKAFDKMDEEAALSKLKNSGDAVITIVLPIRKKKENIFPAICPIFLTVIIITVFGATGIHYTTAFMNRNIMLQTRNTL